MKSFSLPRLIGWGGLSLIWLLLSVGCLAAPAGQSDLAAEYCEIAAAYQDLEEYGKASDYYLKAIRLDPELKVAAVGLIRVYLEEGNFRKAADLARRERQADQENHFLVELQAYALYRLDEHRHSLDLYQSILAEYPDHYRALFNGTAAAEELELPELVVEYCSRMGEAWPEEPRRTMAHVRALRDLEREDEAVSLLEDRMDRDGLAAGEKLFLGKLYKKQELYARAVEMFEMVTGDSSSAPDLKAGASFYLAELLLLVVGNKERGLEELEQALKHGFRDEEAAEQLMKGELKEGDPADIPEDLLEDIRDSFREAGWGLDPLSPPQEAAQGEAS